MAYRYHGRATVNPHNPAAFARCDRCGFIYNHRQLQFQFDYRGPRLANLKILVCKPCYDKPQAQLKPIVLTQDPMPIINARPENFLDAENTYRTTMDGKTRVTQDGQPRVVQWNVGGDPVNGQPNLSPPTDVAHFLIPTE